MKGCIDFYCPRCSREFPVHLLYPRVGPGFREHQEECIGCEPPTPTFHLELVELRPYDAPSAGILDFKTFSFKMDASVEDVAMPIVRMFLPHETGMCEEGSCNGTGTVIEGYDDEREFQRTDKRVECPRCKGSGFEPMEG